MCLLPLVNSSSQQRKRPLRLDRHPSAATVATVKRDLGIELGQKARVIPRIPDRERNLRPMRLTGLPEDIWPEVSGPAVKFQRLLEQAGPQGPGWPSHVSSLRDAIRAGRTPESMTPREIVAIYQGLDNDRLYWYEDGRDSRDWHENDPAMWARKAAEARTGAYRTRFPGENFEGKTVPAPTFEQPGFPLEVAVDSAPAKNWEGSLYDSIVANGVLGPISLSDRDAVLGQLGLPQVLGGTHRLAVALEVAPDRPVPVSFHSTLVDAISYLGDRY